MQSENAIEVRDVTKSFRVYKAKGNTLKEKLLFWHRNEYELRKVLRGISFSVRSGEAVGLIGHNGCGKSTTLKLLTRIMYPDSGTIEMKGRVSSLIELGAGFHPDMSGRENIYTNASIFGLTRKEIEARIERIIEFSELESFIDNPVRTYSSGMYMRLAFAVAINVDADILLIDEILAVGDASFQEKCFRKLREIKANGTTIVIVSHALGQIEKICDRCIWIHEGQIREEGTPTNVHAMYMDYMRVRSLGANAGGKNLTESEDGKPLNLETIPGSGVRTGSHKAFGTGIRLLNKDQEETVLLHTGEKAYIEVSFEVREPLNNAAFRWNFYRSDFVQCFASNTRNDRLPEFDLEKSGRLLFEMSSLELLPGEYSGDFRIVCGEEDENVDFISQAVSFVVSSSEKAAGIVYLRHQWILEKNDEKSR